MSALRIYAFAIPVFALFLLGGSWPTAAGVGSCSSAFWSCVSQCTAKFKDETCLFRKLNPTVLMMKSAQDVAGDDAAAALNRSAMWGIFLQTEMGPCRVVIRSVFLQHTSKMGLAPHDHVVKTLTSDRADCALDISVLPWRSRRDRAVANAHRPNPPREYRAISAVIVADEKGRDRVPGKGFGDLVGQPFGCRVRGDADP